MFWKPAFTTGFDKAEHAVFFGDWPKSTRIIFWIFTYVMIIYLSRIAWYDIRTIYAQIGQHYTIVTELRIWAVLIAPTYFLLPLFFFDSRFYNIFTLSYVVLLFHTLLSGIWFTNDPVFIVQELAKYVYPLIAFMLTVWLCARVPSMAILNFLKNVVVFFILLRVLIFFALDGFNVKLLWGTHNELLLLSVALAMVINRRDWISGTLKQPFSYISLGLMVLGQKRTILLCFVIGILMAGFAMLVRFRIFRLTAFVSVGVLLASLVFLMADPEYLNKITETDLSKETSDSSRRIVEIGLVVDKFQDHPERLLLGFGGGATLYLPDDLITKSEPLIHSVHNTLSALIYRHGLIGLYIYFLTLFYGIFWCLGRVKDRSDQILRTSILFYKILVFIASMFIFGVIDDMILGVLAGIVFYNKRYSHEKR